MQEMRRVLKQGQTALKNEVDHFATEDVQHCVGEYWASLKRKGTFAGMACRMFQPTRGITATKKAASIDTQGQSRSRSQ